MLTAINKNVICCQGGFFLAAIFNLNMFQSSSKYYDGFEISVGNEKVA